jgi:hypothetical protein
MVLQMMMTQHKYLLRSDVLDVKKIYFPVKDLFVINKGPHYVSFTVINSFLFLSSFSIGRCGFKDGGHMKNVIGYRLEETGDI